MSVQTTVAASPIAGRPGQLYDDSPHEIGTVLATTAIPFGALVCNQTEGNGNVPDATGEVTGFRVGVALIDPVKASGVGYEIGDAVRVMWRGRAFVLNEEALVFNTQPFARFVATPPEQLCAWRTDNDGGSDAVAVPGAKVLKAGAVNLAVVELDP
jgi:hypothetical protein